MEFYTYVVVASVQFITNHIEAIVLNNTLRYWQARVLVRARVFVRAPARKWRQWRSYSARIVLTTASLDGGPATSGGVLRGFGD